MVPTVSIGLHELAPSIVRLLFHEKPARMVSTQPLPEQPASALRLVPAVATESEPDAVPVTPIFDLTPQLGANRAAQPVAVEPEDELKPFSFDDFDNDEPADAAPIASLLSEQTIPVTGMLSGTSGLTKRATSYLNGLSLAAILQMLHMERKTCVVDVSAFGWLGSLTLINGELVDARVGETSGEDAAYTILNWPEPQVMIADGVETVQPTVTRPITQVIMDAARRIDETAALEPGPDTAESPVSLEDWQWLTDSLTLFGAQNVCILTMSTTEICQTGMLDQQSRDLARAVRTWTTLLGDSASEVVLTRADRMIIVAPINPAHTAFVYAETLNSETSDRIRRSLRSLSLHR